MLEYCGSKIKKAAVCFCDDQNYMTSNNAVLTWALCSLDFTWWETVNFPQNKITNFYSH